METKIVRRDKGLNLQFVGERVARVASSGDHTSSDYSGSSGRWTELALYRTQAGALICEQINRSSWKGEQDGYNAAVCESSEAVMTFFGNGALAKNLYAAASIGTESTQD